ncbi:unnamed protein product [Penicillium salamii]|uniref:BZIP domain-containing protein n=1 Tax=Penicillium salamii TaxID=1612424 RepID=A0A9W4J269_9EURO|nr:unnamed protein product [Penicillium salamii]CAG7965725.1 unnamed protein product [Penicillium salamii]CAG8018898.1 unnamed protein product [Penicillium salamii]CAG8088747.1 unnamed protein product [Penicillium salamii]CAG8162707.1 unnamed protein product [Penicillium salamii]
MASAKSTPASARKRPTSQGRPRLDAPAAKLSEDRRNQIRRAQKTYRLKKEACIQESQQRVTELEHKLARVEESLKEYRNMLQYELGNTHSELLNGCDRIVELLATAPENRHQNENDSQNSHQNSSHESSGDTPSDSLSSVETTISNQAIPNYPSTREPSATAEGQSGTRDLAEPQINNELTKFISESIHRSLGCTVNYSYASLESSFTRRLKRSSLEHAFQIFSDPHSNPHEVFRLFRLVPCFRDREKMYPYFRDLVTSDRDHSLEISALPFYNIGGAGTHYPNTNSDGAPVYPRNMRIPRRILGIIPNGDAGDRTTDTDESRQNQLQLCGFGGEWFDCRDVEGYLRQKGVQIDESCIFPTVKQAQNDVTRSEDPENCVLDLEGFIEVFDFEIVFSRRTIDSFQKLQNQNDLCSLGEMPDTSRAMWKPSVNHISIAVAVFIGYMILVRRLRYKRMVEIQAPFAHGRELSTMTTEEAYGIISRLQELEFPYAFEKARKIALLKAGAIPTMSKLFAVTGQNNKRNSGKRAVDTEILLREAQSKPRDSDRYMRAVARMNYLHARYRKANKITDDDLLHTLGDGLFEIVNVISREEWRELTDVETCALGVFHKNLGEDMGIPFDNLPSCKEGWTNGSHFAAELQDWTLRYEKEVAKPTATNDQYVRVYVDSALSSFPGFARTAVRQMLGANLDEVMRSSLQLESPGPIFSALLVSLRELRKLFLRHLALPRVGAVKPVNETPNSTGLYSFGRKTLQPWYMEPTFLSSWGPGAMLVRALGGKVPGSRGDRYHPQGYDLMTIGPEPQKEKGAEEMVSDMEIIRARRMTSCPFSQAKNGFMQQSVLSDQE